LNRNIQDRYRLRNIRIKNKLLFSYILLSLIPLLIVSILTFNQYSNDLKTKLGLYSVKIMDQSAKNMKTRIDAIEGFCYELMLYEEVQRILREYNTQSISEKRNRILKITDFLDDRFFILDHLNFLEIYSNDQTLLYSSGFSSFNEKEIGRIFYLIDKNKGAIGWDYLQTLNKHNIAVVSGIYDEDTKQKLGFFILAIDEKWFSDVFTELWFGEGADTFILNEQGLLISKDNNKFNLGTIFPEKGLIEKIKINQFEEFRNFHIPINDKMNLVSFAKIEKAEWYIVSTIPFSYINGEAWNVGFTILLILLACIVTGIILAFIISQNLSHPITDLIHAMDSAKNGNFSLSIKHNRKDELGYLTDEFNRMFLRINELIAIVKLEQENKRRAEIKMLQAQIKPHFLFNTLNTFKWMAEMSQADSVADGIKALIGLLENTIIEDKELISLREEIKNIQNYIVIQKLRYGTIFDFKTVIPTELNKVSIPKFLLQPVIENSIIHGIDDLDYQGHIIISCQKIGKDIQLIIKDNGRGISKESIKEIISTSKSVKGGFSHIGLSNVIERIKMNFGEHYNLSIQSELGKGTITIITLPYIEIEEGKAYVQSIDS